MIYVCLAEQFNGWVTRQFCPFVCLLVSFDCLSSNYSSTNQINKCQTKTKFSNFIHKIWHKSFFRKDFESSSFRKVRSKKRTKFPNCSWNTARTECGRYELNMNHNTQISSNILTSFTRILPDFDVFLFYFIAFKFWCDCTFGVCLPNDVSWFVV